MIFLFRSGAFREKCWIIYKATRLHAKNLATFALIYKSLCLFLRSSRGKEHASDTFLAGLAGGYYVFGRSKSSVNQQIVLYVAARVVLALAALAVQPPGDNALVGSKYGDRGGMGILRLSDDARMRIRKGAWPAFASLSWGLVMWLFRYYPEMLQPSLRSSMTYMYVSRFLFFSPIFSLLSSCCYCTALTPSLVCPLSVTFF